MKNKIKNLIYILTLVISIPFVFSYEAKAANTGTTTSPIYDAGKSVNFSSVSWTETVPSLTSIVLEVKIGSNSDLSDAAWVTVSNGQSLASYVGKRYYQYKATLSSDDLNSVPSLNDVNFNYSYYPTKIPVDLMEYSTNGSAQAAYVSNGSTYASKYPPSINGTYVRTTSYYVGLNVYGYNAANPANALDGGYDGNGWLSGNGANTNQRFHIDLGSAKTINRIYLENHHHGGGELTRGVKNFTFWGSNNASDFADLTYANNGTWTQLSTDITQFRQHTAVSASDPQYATVNSSNSYRYYAFKFADNWGEGSVMGVRRIELQTSPLQSYSENNAINEGQYSLKGIAETTTSLNKTLTRTLSTPLDLSLFNNIRFDLRAARTGSNIKIGMQDSGGVITETVPNITSADNFQTFNLDFSNVANVNKDAINKIIITILNADADNIFYLDNFRVDYVIDKPFIISSPYDTSSEANVLSKILWTENLPTNTDVQFQIRTSPDNSIWTSWMGIDGTDQTYFTSPDGSESIPAALSDSANDRWIQYKAFLSTTDTSVTPTISQLNMRYVVNAKPEFNPDFPTPGVGGVAASQQDTGEVKIDFSVRDPDTAGGTVTPNSITPTYYYSLDNGANYSQITNGLSAGASNPKAVQEVNFSNYSVTWNAAQQLGNNVNIANAKIRVVVTDNEPGPNTTQKDSGAFSLNTMIPTLGSVPIKIDASVSPAVATLDATDVTALEMKVSTSPTLEGAVWEPYNTTKQITLSAFPATVYFQVKNANGFTSIIASAVTPGVPAAMMTQDTSNLNIVPSENRLFVAWKVVDLPSVGFGSYKIYRSTDQSTWNLIGTITNRTINYYGDSSVAGDTNYYYKVATIDANGNISAYSSIVNGKANGIQDAGEGGGGTGEAPPVISDVTAEQITSTSAKITWNTDKLSDSIVSYQAAVGGDFSAAPIMGTLSMTDNSSGLGKHEVVLTGLTPNRTYYYKVTSRDIAGGLSSDLPSPNGYSFQTASGPIITLGSVSPDNDSATINWTTTIAESEVNYATSVLGGELVNPIKMSSASGTSHSVNIENLSPTDTYYFSISATDSNGGTTIANNSGNFYTFTAVPDSVDPVISNVAHPIVTTNLAAITWTTDEAATTQVGYSLTSGGPYTKTTKVTDYDRNHSAIINVAMDKKYYYVVYSDDIYGNPSVSTEYSFTSAKTAELNHDPLSGITFSSNNPSVLTDVAAVISFSTDQAANCFIEYGTASGNYTFTPVRETENVYNYTHSLALSGLLFDTKHFYKVTCEDNLGTVISSGEKDFTTKEKMVASSLAGGDGTPPAISNVRVTGITGESVVISWDTDEKSSSTVRYGISDTDEFGAVESAVNKSSNNYATKHTVVIHGLVPATKYVFIASSADASGNIADSSQDSFTTASPSSLSSIKAESFDLGQATITWNTDKEITSIVEYGLSTSYGEKEESSSLTKQHSINLDGLQQGETYHFRVKGKDEDGMMYASSDNTFEPKSPPKIQDVSVNEITEHGAIVRFSTDVATNATVSYVNIADAKDNGSQSSTERASQHVIELKNLSQGTTYNLKVKVSDEQGTESEQNANDLTTGKDENPPKIDQVRTDAALTQSDKVQAIISWKTDEQSDTAIVYKEGRNGTEKEVKISDNLTTSHVAVVTVFKPGTVYYFKVKSIDSSGNTGTSSDFALLTPKRRENIIQIIINNFQEIFGWARR